MSNWFAQGVLMACWLVCAVANASDAIVHFNDLDLDANGYINRTEGLARDDLTRNWIDIDHNHDNRLDYSEFSAFEEIIETPLREIHEQPVRPRD